MGKSYSFRWTILYINVFIHIDIEIGLYFCTNPSFSSYTPIKVQYIAKILHNCIKSTKFKKKNIIEISTFKSLYNVCSFAQYQGHQMLNYSNKMYLFHI